MLKPSIFFPFGNATVSRGLFPAEKDIYAVSWFRSLWRSTISLGLCGIGLMAVSFFGLKLIFALATLYMPLSESVIDIAGKTAKMAFFSGGAMVIKSLMNIRSR